MKKTTIVFLSAAALLAACNSKDGDDATTSKQLFMDVHNLGAGNVTAAAVADAHLKDLAVQDKYGVKFLTYWVDEAKGKVYCLAEGPDAAAVTNTHKEAHGLLPDVVATVTDGTEAAMISHGHLFMDVHNLGAGNVTAAAVADAHVKDLAVQQQYNVNFINYWVDETRGLVMCLAEAPDSAALANTHKEAHGLVPHEVHLVAQGH